MDDETGYQDIDETIRQQFEAGWLAGEPQPIEAVLSDSKAANYLATLEELVHIELEFRWKNRDPLNRVQLEKYLERFESLNQPAIVKRLIQQEVRCRAAIGETPVSEDYQPRFQGVTVEFPSAPQDTGWAEQAQEDTDREIRTIMPLAREAAVPPDGATIGPSETSLDDPGGDTDAVPGYELLGELGRGGMGVVYQARDTKLKRTVALKMILSGAHASDEDMQRFQMEAEAVARLQHPNIVQIFEVGEHQGNPYISLEYQQGGGLDQKIAGKPQNIEESAKLIETLSRAMEVAHQQEIIHRDLKPANILLSSEGEPKITDFGLAKRMDDDSNQTKTGAVMGTPSYMPPEQASSSIETLGPAADTYALGAILYHLLTGRPPFQSETQLDTLMQVISDEPVPPSRLNSNVPADLETICLKCLQKDIKRRYTTAAALAEDLRRFQTGEPIAARPVSALERGWKWARRRPAVAGMIGVSALALISLIAGGLWYNAQLQDSLTVAENRRQEAQEQREFAEKQRKVAEKQKEAADRNFKLARDAVDELTTVSQDELFNLPQMEPVRRALLEKAKAFYETFVDQAAGDPTLASELGKAQNRFGVILKLLGDMSSAQSEFEKAILIQKQLAKDHPDVKEYASELAKSYSYLAGTLADSRLNEFSASRQKEQAIELYHKVIVIQEQLVEEHPDVSDDASDLANSYGLLAQLYFNSKQGEQSIKLHHKAIAIQEQLVEEHPGVPEYEFSLAAHYANHAGILTSLGKTDEAIELNRKSIAIVEQLFDDYPGVPKYANRLGPLYYNLANTFLYSGQAEPAIELYLKAHPFQEKKAKDHPDVPQYASALAQSYGMASFAYGGNGQTEEALVLYRKAASIQEQLAKDHPEVPEYASALAKTHYNGACHMSLASAAAAQNKELPIAERKTLEEQYAAQAMELLIQSKSGGYLDVPANVTHLKKTDTTLDPLRQRDDFKKFVETLKTD